MIGRRGLLGTGLAAALLPRAGLAAGPPVPFDAGMVLERARAAAAQDYAPAPNVPPEWLDLTYDQYRGIVFDHRRSLWTGTDSPVHVDLFPPGLYFERPVAVHLVEDGMATPVPYDRTKFRHSEIVPDLPAQEELGFSGIRLRTEWKGDGNFEEFAVFQGASYFRMIPKGGIYGLSARGLAIGTGGPEEEFPDFTTFWVERPAPDAETYSVHALLDGPTATGAYRFDVTPGDETHVRVTATLFARRDADHLGLAPLTSMFLFDETNRNRFDDFRPAVHDSDGLTMHNGAGERVWRPLANPAALQISSFVDEDPRGFGLSQRAQDQRDFADLEALYHRRPSLWIEPGEGWGRGVVRLIEIPADKEIYDNVVAYWLPSAALPAGEAMSFSYAMTWRRGLPEAPVAQVVQTRIGKGFESGRVCAIDFGPHPDLEGDLDGVESHIAATAGDLSDGVLQRNPETGGVRLDFALEPGTATFSELRAQLRRDGRPISEVWLYRWTT